MPDRVLTLVHLRVTPRLLREMTRDCTVAQAATPPKPGHWASRPVRRSFLGLLPKRCQARLALSVPELTAALRATPRLMAEVVGGLDATERLGLSGRFGPVTLAQYATHAADHDQEHLAQMRDSRAALPRRA